MTFHSKREFQQISRPKTQIQSPSSGFISLNDGVERYWKKKVIDSIQESRISELKSQNSNTIHSKLPVKLQKDAERDLSLTKSEGRFKSAEKKFGLKQNLGITYGAQQ